MSEKWVSKKKLAKEGPKEEEFGRERNRLIVKSGSSSWSGRRKGRFGSRGETLSLGNLYSMRKATCSRALRLTRVSVSVSVSQPLPVALFNWTQFSK